MLAILWTIGCDSGFHSDEMDMSIYGKANIAYYASGGKDTSYKKLVLEDGTEVSSILHYYGSGFEYFAAGLIKIFGKEAGYEYNIRHMLNQFFAILAVLFAGLTAQKVMKQYRPAFITAWLLFLTPFFLGNAIFNTKDIPFLTGYIAATYFLLCFLEGLPRPSWKIVAGLMLALAFTLSVRIGGVLLIAYLCLFVFIYWRTDKALKTGLLPAMKDWGLKALVAVSGALLITVLIWPFALEAPLANLQKSINVARDFPQRIPIIFEGEYLDSLNIPAYFLAKYMVITIPVLIILLFASSVLYFVRYYKRFQWRILLFIGFASIFPLFYAIYTKMPVYNGWRHLLFVYPGITVLSGAGLHVFLNLVKRPAYQWALAGICVGAMIHPAAWILKNGHYTHMYYNELSGGFGEMYYQYESDYWQISVKEGIDWLMQHEKLAERKDSITLGTNAFSFASYYLKRRYPDAPVRVVQCGYRRRFMVPWDYAVINIMFLTPQTLEYGFPPRGITIHTVDVAERAICAVVKDTARFDLKGIDAFNRGNFVLADSCFDQYVRLIGYDPSGPDYLEGIVSLIGFARLANNKPYAALPYAQKALAHDAGDYFANLTAGIIYFHRGNMTEARRYLQTARNVNPQDMYAAQYLAQIAAAGR